MIIVVSNLWPRAQFYERVTDISAKLNDYRGDRVIDQYDKLFPIQTFQDVHRSENAQYAAKDERTDNNSEEFGGLSEGTIPFEVLRQYVFFTLVLRALLLRHASEVTGVVAYCSGIVPVLNAMTSEWCDEGVAQLSATLIGQLQQQDGMVTRNVCERDVVQSVMRFTGAGWNPDDVRRRIAVAVGDGAYVTDVKAEDVVVISGYRAKVEASLLALRAQSPVAIDASRLVPHGGLHTPLAAPDRCLQQDGDPSWSVLCNGLARTPLRLFTSAGEYFDPADGADELERLVRATFFKTVQSGQMTRTLQESGEQRMFIGLPSVLLDMFVGTGLRPRRNEIVGPQHI